MKSWRFGVHPASPNCSTVDSETMFSHVGAIAVGSLGPASGADDGSVGAAVPGFALCDGSAPGAALEQAVASTASEAMDAAATSLASGRKVMSSGS